MRSRMWNTPSCSGALPAGNVGSGQSGCWTSSGLRKDQPIIRPSFREGNSSGWQSPGRLQGIPLLVLADEPTGNLDSGTGTEIIALMREINRERGISFLVVTHDADLAAEADRTIQLLDGRVQE